MKSYQLSDVLAKLDIDTAVGKAQLLQPICTPGMACALCLLILVPAQIPEAPFVVCRTGSSWRLEMLCDKHSMLFSQWCKSGILVLTIGYCTKDCRVAGIFLCHSSSSLTKQAKHL